MPSAPGCSWSLSPGPATTSDVTRSAGGVIVNLEKKRSFVNHYSLHIVDPVFGHVTIKMSGHPPFPAQIILNGHEYVTQLARTAGIAYRKERNCFTGTLTPRAWPSSQTP